MEISRYFTILKYLCCKRPSYVDFFCMSTLVGSTPTLMRTNSELLVGSRSFNYGSAFVVTHDPSSTHLSTRESAAGGIVGEGVGGRWVGWLVEFGQV